MKQEAYETAITIQRRLSNEAKGDARPSAFYKLAQLFHSSKIYFILNEEYLQYRKWYDETYIKKWNQRWPIAANVDTKNIRTLDDHKLLNNDFYQVMLIGYTHTLFSIMESRFRLFVEALRDTPISNITQDPTVNFGEILDALLEDIKQEGHTDFIKFFALIRNTIHNNGVYLNKRKQPPVTYKGKTYYFEYRKPVNYYPAFEFLIFDLTPEVISMFKEIILNSEKILTIPWIPDPMQ
jgi:hypothetical protein